ncbi:MAG: DUF952 domain-containing protein [Hyphomicrobium sp.]
MPDTRERQHVVFKILPASDWTAAVAAGDYTGSANDNRGGFIHFSAAHQVAGTAARHFRGQGDLVLVAVLAEALGDALVWEPSRGGDLFPHLYGVLPVAAALWTKPMVLGQDGIPIVPADLDRC